MLDLTRHSILRSEQILTSSSPCLEEKLHLLRHECLGPGLSGAPEQASLITGTEHLTVLLEELVSFIEDKVPAAGEAEHVGHVARALDNVCVDVLQIVITIIALEIYSPDVIIGFIQISKKRFRNLKMLKIFLL